MVATCVIELVLLVYTVWRYKFNKLTRLVSLQLLFLAIFQLAEFHVCRGSSYTLQWSHIGYAAITLLPPLGIHIIQTIRGRKNSILVPVAYLSAAVFVAYFAFTARSLTGDQCLGNYVMFQVNPKLTDLYGIYYYGWVLAGMLLSMYYGDRTKEKRLRQALYGFAAGYAVFLVPTTTANLLDKATLQGIPSIMCGFAVLFALITVTLVLPRTASRRHGPKGKKSLKKL